MIEIKSPWRGLTDREKWAARGASFVMKAKATKVVWFPPKPAETGEKAASTAKRATKKTTKRATKTTIGAGKNTIAAAKTANPGRQKKS